MTIPRCGQRRESPNRRSRRAFTLIELLVVIAVIAVLLAILLPALAVAREQGRLAVDLSNIHQLASTCFAYASDQDGYLPWGRRYNWPQDHYRSWFRGSTWVTLHDTYGLPESCGTCIDIDQPPTWILSYDPAVTSNTDVGWGWTYWGNREDMIPYGGSNGYISPKKLTTKATSHTLVTCLLEDDSMNYWASCAPHHDATGDVYLDPGNSPFIHKPRVVGVGYTDGSAAFVQFTALTPIREAHPLGIDGVMFYDPR